MIKLQWSNVSQVKCLAALSCDLSLITIHISDIRISQGSVATYLRCGGIFKCEFVANLPLSLPAKEFRKSVNIWESYGQEFSVLFFWLAVYSWQLDNTCNGRRSTYDLGQLIAPCVKKRIAQVDLQPLILVSTWNRFSLSRFTKLRTMGIIAKNDRKLSKFWDKKRKASEILTTAM